jgi:hypothetical protein
MGAYLETRLIGLNSVSLGIELEVVNQGAPPPTTNPFLVGANGSATGIMIAAGGDPTQTTGTVYGNAAALAVTGGQNAGAGWQVGMVMGNGSLNVGADGFCRAMDMPALYDIRWTDSIGQSGVITVPGSISANAVVSDAPAATYHTNAFTTAGSNRWAWGMDNVAESGGAGGYGGGNMFFQSYNNSGAAPVVALQLQRNGQVNIGFCAIAGGSINGTAIGNTSASSGNFTQVQVAATKVLGAQITGWGTPTGPSRIASFPGASATLVQCSSAIAQIIADLKTHGMLGA